MAAQSHGTGEYNESQFAYLGKGVVFEKGVLVFHPENIEIYDDVYVGHYTILKGYHLNRMVIGKGTWIGQQCFFHSAGGIKIGCNVGIGPGVKILTSSHTLDNINIPIVKNPIEFKPVIIMDDSDIGVGSIIMPGVTIGKGAQIGAGSVVTKTVENYAVVAGVPATLLHFRK